MMIQPRPTPIYIPEDEVESIPPPVLVDELPAPVEAMPAVVVIQPLPNQPRAIGGRVITAPPATEQGVYRQPGRTGGVILTG